MSSLAVAEPRAVDLTRNRGDGVEPELIVALKRELGQYDRVPVEQRLEEESLILMGGTGYDRPQDDHDGVIAKPTTPSFPEYYLDNLPDFEASF